MHFLVGLLTGSNAACRLQAVRCLLELSHSHHTSVAPACLPSTPYLLTYLSSQSTKFTVSICMKVCVVVLATFRRIFLPFFVVFFFLMCLQELCLYTLGNLCPADVVKNKLVAQGIIPALANCIEVNTRFKQTHPGKTEFCFYSQPLVSAMQRKCLLLRILCVFRTTDLTLLWWKLQASRFLNSFKQKMQKRS